MDLKPFLFIKKTAGNYFLGIPKQNKFQLLRHNLFSKNLALERAGEKQFSGNLLSCLFYTVVDHIHLSDRSSEVNTHVIMHLK